METKVLLMLALSVVFALPWGAAAQQLSDDAPVTVVERTCHKTGSLADCAEGGPRVFVVRSNTEEVASYPAAWVLPALAFPRGAVTAAGPNADGAFVSVSGASFQGPILAADSIVSGFGQGLATTTATAEAIPLPTSLAGTIVTVTDSAGETRLAPLFFVSPTQVNYLIPAATKAGSATVRVVSGDGTISNGTLTIETVAPGLFSANASGDGVAAALVLRVKPDTSQIVEQVFQYDGGLSKYVPLPINPGPETDQIFLLLFGTGIRLRSDISAVKVRIGGVDCEVSYAGDQGGFAGLDQVNVRLPRTVSGRGELEIELTVDGKPANVVTVAVGGPLVNPPPQIASMNPNGADVGQTLSGFTIAGQNLDGVAAIEFWPSSGITVSGLTATSTAVTAQVSVAPEAEPGARMVSVISALGRSNKLPFTIRAVGPHITSLSPNIGDNGQTIAGFTITGENLAGATAVEFSPATGITVTGISATATTVTAQVAIAADAPAGTRAVSVVTPLGQSNTLNFTVRLAAPHIDSLNPNAGDTGQVISAFKVNGQSLSGVTAIEFSPSTGITVSNVSATATTVTAKVTIASDAPTGTRSVSVVSPAGKSNTLNFSVRQAGPTINTLNPSSASQGDVISSFKVNGQNLSGVTAIEFSPSTDITVSNISATATTVTAKVTIDANASTGTRSVSVVSPAGKSNTLNFTVNQKLSATPVISNVVVDTPTATATLATITGSLKFTDGDADIVYTGSSTGSAKLKFSMTVPAVSCTISSYGSFLDKPGQTSGTITFSLKVGYSTKTTGTFTVKVSLVDGAGHESNVVSVSPGAWYCRLLDGGPDENPLGEVESALEAMTTRRRGLPA